MRQDSEFLPAVGAVCRRLGVPLALVLLGGCATTMPPVSGPTLGVAAAREAPPAEPVEVRWGGTIAAVRNTAEGTTELEIVSRPLRRGGRPLRDDTSDGRFLAEVSGFLDPEIVTVGRDITVSGRVEGRREGRVGESAYAFPLVRVSDYHYWEPEPVRRYAAYPYPYPYAYPYPYLYPYPAFGLYDGYGWPYSPYGPRGRSGAFVGGAVRF